VSSSLPKKGLEGTGNEIYIDCQPTNESEEEIVVTTSKSESSGFTLNDILNSQVFQIVIVIILVIICIFFGKMLLNNRIGVAPLKINNPFAKNKVAVNRS
jgi:hypothetical protein